MHFGTFQLTSEGIDEPIEALDEACHMNGIPRSRFHTFEAGESLRVPREDSLGRELR
jgi:hypothetical protein